MKTIVVDGITYVPADQSGEIKIVVIERGFVYVGRVQQGECNGERGMQICSARSLIRWGSSQHLGELVNGPLENTQLGAPCTVRVHESQIIHTIEVNQDAWKSHIVG